MCSTLRGFLIFFFASLTPITKFSPPFKRQKTHKILLKWFQTVQYLTFNIFTDHKDSFHGPLVENICSNSFKLNLERGDRMISLSSKSISFAVEHLFQQNKAALCTYVEGISMIPFIEISQWSEMPILWWQFLYW